MKDSDFVWRVNRKPRSTVLEMGEYMAADEGPRETILRNLKYERIAPSLIYNKLNQAVSSFLTSPTLDRRILHACRAELEGERDRADSVQRRENHQYEINALDAFERSLNALDTKNVTYEKLPQTGRPVDIDGVRISVRPTVRVRVHRSKGKDLIGALLVDTAKGVLPKTPEAEAKLTHGMTYSAILLHRQVGEILAERPDDEVRLSPEHCIVFHTNRQQQVVCPSSSRKLMRNVEAGCRNIARGWDGIVPPQNFDHTKARYR